MMENTHMMKLCRICNTMKHSSEFYKNKAKSDGLQSHCKVCDNKRRSKYHYNKKASKNNDTAQPKAKKVPQRTKLKQMNPPKTIERKRSVNATTTKSLSKIDGLLLEHTLKVKQACKAKIRNQQRSELIKIKSVINAKFGSISKSIIGEQISVSATMMVNKKAYKYESAYLSPSEAEALINQMHINPKDIASEYIHFVKHGRRFNDQATSMVCDQPK
ncbi:hypothetical protein B9T13_10055 [Wohlfahrtiimonas chitiniclastica]|nr:hypothetical protein B9T13_10055 [Wohlfahrtiimonas chitiniclastica]